ncbi:DUF47 domain-containing protein [Halostella litorea]|uniref:DUF47 domain-containing protein n=1 Tax=Halostella litorea TaxID=2528831 RepID=UPI001091A71D|nr:DUF47 family protein [Halostella litorea]
MLADKTDPNDLADAVDEFLTALVDGTDLLRTLVDAYGEDGTEFDRAVDRLARLESHCDDLAGEVRRAVTAGAEPSFSTGYLFSADLVEAVGEADDVVSNAETFAKELAVMRPSLSDDALAGLRQLAWTAHDATRHLAAAFREWLSAGGGDADEVGESLAAVRRLERDCDAVKYDLIDAAFEGGSDAEALVVRELAVGLDDVANAAEDAADALAAARAGAV